MKKQLIVGLAAALLTPTIGYAQGGTMTAAAAPQSAGGGGRLIAGSVQAKITTGRPYSAEAVNETVQVLGDGNRISRTSTTRVYRDGEGRTRRDMLAEDGAVRTIAIADNVAQVNYTLDPKEKIAYKSGGNIVAPGGRGGTYTLTQRPEGQASAAAPTSTATAVGRGGGGGGAVMRTPAPDDPNVKKEDLGTQNVEGVSATGTRTTTIIPVGQIGNAREIRIVSEQWFSEELQVLVMTRHSDPRTGETTYRLRNILRAEPDPSLFTVPADYTVQQRGVR